MFHSSARVKAGQTILLHGANGGVGGILIQLAQQAGVRVIGTASPRHHNALRAAGVEPVDYNDPNLAARVRQLAPGGVDAAFDNVGGAMMHTSWSLLAPGGTLVCYAIVGAAGGTGSLIKPFLAAVGQVLLWDLLPNGHHATFYDVWSGHSLRPAQFRQHLVEDLGQLLKLLASGSLKANVAARFPLTDVVEAFKLAESRTVNGKIILLP